MGLYLKYAGLLQAQPANWIKFLKECRTTSISNLSFSTKVQLGQNSAELDNLAVETVYKNLFNQLK